MFEELKHFEPVNRALIAILSISVLFSVGEALARFYWTFQACPLYLVRCDWPMDRLKATFATRYGRAPSHSVYSVLRGGSFLGQIVVEMWLLTAATLL
jgi:hypothetical protein